MIYSEYCDIVFDKHFYYEFDCWQENSDLIEFILGQLVCKVLKSEDFIDYDDNCEALEDAFIELVENERYKVVDCLIDSIGESGSGEFW